MTLNSLDSILRTATFACCVAVVVLSPWLFASWEVWYFWPFVVLVFSSSLFLAVRLVLAGLANRPLPGPDDDPDGGRVVDFKRLWLCLLSFVPFLAYALAWLFHARVYTDAERSFLLFLTPFLLAVVIVVGLTASQRALLYKIILGNLCLLAAYGLVNHAVTGSRDVLWLPGERTYTVEKRLTGTYICPDHFAGLMEIALCLSFGILLARDTAWRRKGFAAALAMAAVAIVVLSKSRGGGLTVLVVAMAVLVWGFPQWPPRARLWWRISAISLVALVLLLFCAAATTYTTRFLDHFGGAQVQGKSWAERVPIVVQALRWSSRGKMYAGAARAWETHPVVGIGPGMHQNLWPHFAPSPDGDREKGIWPSMPNYEFHSYEVHSDWLQLLEEYGVVGLLLLLIPVSILFGAFLAGLRRETARWERHDWRGRSSRHMALILGGFLAGVAMAFHSLGDFNLQMPATVWMLASVVALALAELVRTKEAAA